MKPSSRLLACALPIVTLLLVFNPAAGAGLPTLGDYDEAARTDNTQELRYLRAYILGAVDTHLHYSKKLKNFTRFNALCTGSEKLTGQELGKIFELKTLLLERRYGEDILGMPIVEVVPSIVEEHYRCF